MEKKNIVFDLDNTLIDFQYTDAYAIECLFKNLGISFSKEDYDRYFQFQLDYWYKFENTDQIIDPGEMERIDYVRSRLFQLFFQQHNISIEKGYELMQLYNQQLGVKNILFEYVDEVLKHLYQEYNLFIASNGPREAQIRKLKNTNIQQYFQDLITAEDCGYPKPKKQFFDSMIQRFSINPQETVLVGDSLTSDIAGANNNNIFSIWYNRNGINNTTLIKPNHEIRDLRELKRIKKIL